MLLYSLPNVLLLICRDSTATAQGKKRSASKGAKTTPAKTTPATTPPAPVIEDDGTPLGSIMAKLSAMEAKIASIEKVNMKEK